MKCIVYDEKEKSLKNFNMSYFDLNEMTIDYNWLDEPYSNHIVCEKQITLQGVYENKPIKLDEQTMKKILMYNKSKEFEKINNDIDYYKKQLDYAKEEYDKYIKKFDEVKEKINTFMNSDYDTFEEMYDDEEYYD